MEREQRASTRAGKAVMRDDIRCDGVTYDGAKCDDVTCDDVTCDDKPQSHPECLLRRLARR